MKSATTKIWSIRFTQGTTQKCQNKLVIVFSLMSSHILIGAVNDFKSTVASRPGFKETEFYVKSSPGEGYKVFIIFFFIKVEIVQIGELPISRRKRLKRRGS